MKNWRNYSPYTFIDYSIVSLIFWKYAILRKFLSTFVTVYLFSGNKRKLKKTKKIKGAFSGPALIAAGGPSLGINDAVFDFFKSRNAIIGVNLFPLTDKGRKFPPDFLVICDAPFFRKNTSEFEDFTDIVNGNLTLKRTNFVIQPAEFDPFFSESTSIYINTNTLLSFSNSIDVTEINGLYPLTVYFAIASAIYLGFSPIYTVGFDANQFLTLKLEANDSHMKNSHYLGASKEETHRDYKHREKISDFLSFMSSSISFMKIFKRHDVFTLGDGSYVDTIPNVSEEEFLATINKID
jgi:hypothetical protein